MEDGHTQLAFGFVVNTLSLLVFANYYIILDTLRISPLIAIETLNITRQYDRLSSISSAYTISLITQFLSVEKNETIALVAIC